METPVGAGASLALPSGAGRSWADPLSFSFSGKMSSSLTENVHITSVAHILTFKGRDSVHCESFQLQ